MSVEAMKLALEALEKVTKHFTRTHSTLMDSEARVEAHSAITALRQALEQPADEPVTWQGIHDTIKLAREAGLDPDLWNYTDAFERFAALVAEHEREACAKVCETMGEDGYGWVAITATIRARGEQ